MFTKTEKTLSEVDKIFKSEAILMKPVEADSIDDKEEAAEEMDDKGLEAFLGAMIRQRYLSYYPEYKQTITSYGASAQGGYKTEGSAKNDDATAQYIYDDIILMQGCDSTRAYIVIKALKTVKNFSPAYVKKIMAELKKVANG